MFDIKYFILNKIVVLNLGNKLCHINYLHLLRFFLNRIRCVRFAYIFYLQRIINIPTVCSRIISNIYFQVYCVFVKILYPGISTL